MSGKLSRSLTVDSNDAVSPIARLAIEGEIVARLAVEPRQVALRPRTLDERVTADLDVRSNCGRALAGLTAFSATRELALTVTVSGETARVHVAAPPFSDDLLGSIVLRLGSYERIVPVSGVAARDVRVVPDQVAAGVVRPGASIDARLVARRGITWRVRAVESDRKDLTGEADGDLLHVRIAADAARGAFAGTLTLVLEGAKPERLRVPVTAFVKD